MGELLPLLRLHSDPRLTVIMISADDDFDPGGDVDCRDVDCGDDDDDDDDDDGDGGVDCDGDLVPRLVV